VITHNIEDWLDDFDREVSQIVHDTTETAAAVLIRLTPQTQTRTRAAVYRWSGGNRGILGLRFAQRYPIRGTRTERELLQRWAKIRPLARQFMIDRLNNTLSGR